MIGSALDRLKYWLKGWKFLGQGNYRRTYLLPSGRRVIKLPRLDRGDDYGIYCNEGEVRDYRRDKTGKLAKCRPFMYNGQLCTVMEYVKPVSVYEDDYCDLPSWCFGVDYTQVGYTRKGKLVAYDWFYP